MNLFSDVVFGTEFLEEFFTLVMCLELVAIVFNYVRGVQQCNL